MIHLGMSGRVQVVPAGAEVEAHTHLRVFMEDERELRFVDPRRFGGVRFGRLDALLETPPLGSLGPEPLEPEFDGPLLSARAGESRRMLRDLLLDQSVVAGMGNIYVLEALFDAGLHPETRASRLARRPGSPRAARAAALGGRARRHDPARPSRRARRRGAQHALMVYGPGVPPAIAAARLSRRGCLAVGRRCDALGPSPWCGAAGCREAATRAFLLASVRGSLARDSRYSRVLDRRANRGYHGSTGRNISGRERPALYDREARARGRKGRDLSPVRG